MKVLLDTNVILDFAMKRYPFYPDSIAVFKILGKQKISAYISASIATDIVYILSKKFNKEQALLFLRELINNVEIAGVDKKTINNALSSGWADFEDAVQAQVAIENDMDMIITRNSKDFREMKTVKVLTPQEFILLTFNS
jgi:predicted nucleic acid-binding protein